MFAWQFGKLIWRSQHFNQSLFQILFEPLQIKFNATSNLGSTEIYNQLKDSTVRTAFLFGKSRFIYPERFLMVVGLSLMGQTILDKNKCFVEEQCSCIQCWLKGGLYASVVFNSCCNQIVIQPSWFKNYLSQLENKQLRSKLPRILILLLNKVGLNWIQMNWSRKATAVLSFSCSEITTSNNYKSMLFGTVLCYSKEIVWWKNVCFVSLYFQPSKF